MRRTLLEMEWSYLTQEAIDRAASIMVSKGIKDLEVAIEMAVYELGDERAFDLEGSYETGRA